MLTLPRLTKLAALSMFLAYGVILLGVATRVWDAGMSCPDWPKCYGVWVPFPEAHVLPHTPEGYLVNGVHYTAVQVFLEWSHRLLASIVGGLVLLLVAGLMLLKNRPPKALALAVTACVVLTVQIKLGGLTVFLSNIHWSVALHLGGAVLFFGFITMTRYRLAQAQKKIERPYLIPHITRNMFFLWAILIFSTMIVGAMVSSAHAGGVCGSLVNCGGHWWPEDLWQRWHMAHRGLALSVFVLSTMLLIYAKRTAPEFRAAARGLHVVMWGQILLGIATLYSFSHYPDFYRILSLSHLAWGSILWLISVGIICRLTLGEGGQFHKRKHA